MNAIYRQHPSASSFGQVRKVKHYSYAPADRIGKGYSSVVYKGTNGLTSIPSSMQTIQWRLRPST
jgi:hypothetical protein